MSSRSSKPQSLSRYFIPSHLPSFIRRPPRDNGIPVFFDTRRFALVTPSARFHENDKPGPSFTAPPESPPNLPHLVHTYIYVYVDRFTDEPATAHPTRALYRAIRLAEIAFRFGQSWRWPQPTNQL